MNYRKTSSCYIGDPRVTHSQIRFHQEPHQEKFETIFKPLNHQQQQLTQHLSHSHVLVHCSHVHASQDDQSSRKQPRKPLEHTPADKNEATARMIFSN